MSITKKMFIGKYIGPDDYVVTGLPTIDLDVKSSVPFMSLAQHEGRGAITTPSGTAYNLSKKTVIGSNSLSVKGTYRVCGMTVENAFLDSEGLIPNPDYTGLYDRYTTIAYMDSIITKKELALVYDALTTSFFVMPAVYGITDSVTPESCNGLTITMNGYSVGSVQNSKELNTLYTPSMKTTYTLNPALKTTPLQTTTHIMELMIYGSSGGNSDTSGLILDAAGTTYLETLGSPIIELVSLGTVANLVTDGKVNASKLLNMTNGNYHPFNMGKVDISDILIPLYV